MKTLFIVDIQNKYRESFNEEYLNDVIDYINKNEKKYEKIVCIMEDVFKGDYIPSEIYKKLTFYPIFKCYNASYTKENLKNSKYFEVNKGRIKCKVNIPKGSFLLDEKNGFIIGNRANDKIEIDFIDKSFYHLLNSLRDDDITLIGGGLYNCVKKTQSYLKFMDINSSIDIEYCYTVEEDEEICPLNRFDYFIEKKN